MTGIPSNYSLRVLARGAAVLAAALATAAVAQTGSQIDVNARKATVTNVATVSTRGLDLSTGHGRKALDHRIKVAAAKVCDVWEISWDRPQADFTRCFTAALDGGRAQAAQRSARDEGRPIRVSAI